MDFSNLKVTLRRAIREFVYGFVVLSPLRAVREQILSIDLAFLTITFGDMLGLPVFPSIYRYRLLPHFFPLIETWKKQVLKEKEITEKLCGI
jgi:hypothetical protein